jgi:hypothetical protein
LAGLSAIYRCGKTIAQDGAASSVALAVSDGYCIDGNRLRQTGGSSYGTSGSIYMTEIADFSRITANGTSGNGPESWTVERKDGSIFTYGGSSASRVVATDYSYTSSVNEWRISEIRDRAGNKVRFTWKTADGTTYGTTHPEKIEWTQTSSGSGTYVNSMEFIYSAGGNSPGSTQVGHFLTTDIMDSDLLTAITVKVSGTVKRKYVLTYGVSTNDQTLLGEVKECSDSAETDCLTPTTITYQTASSGINTTTHC